MANKLIFDAREDEGEVDDLELTLNGSKFRIFRPTSGQVAIVSAAMSGEGGNVGTATKALLTFYKNIAEVQYEEYDDEGYGVEGTELPGADAAIKAMLENPRISDSFEQVMRLTEQVIESFTGNPTKRPTDYLPPQRSTGRSSTASRRQPASPRSTSRPRASATGSTPSASAG
jgi:hypothetical protein